MNSKLTRYALLAGVVYFCMMAVAHFFGFKLPILFVYFDTPFYAYQDKIISFAVCAYIGLFLSAVRHRDVALNAIIVLGVTVIGLAAVNLSADLQLVLKSGQSLLPYWLQTIAIAVYCLLLLFLYVKDGRNSTAGE